MKQSELLAQMEAWFNQDLDALYSYIVYRVGDRSAADELIAVVYERGLTRLYQFDPKKGAFAAWMFGIARNILNDTFRRNGRCASEISLEALPPIQGRGETPEEQAIRAERFQLVISHLGKLSEGEREAVALRFGGELKYQEIAEVMKISVDQVGVMLYRAIDKLREALNEVEKEDVYEDQGQT
jgi:RNA polymerase sigma factor (sigma-70 family)